VALPAPHRELVSLMYFHDKGTNRRVVLIGLMFCTALVLVGFFARPQPENDRVLVRSSDPDSGEASARELARPVGARRERQKS
jgi:hypothetical protein